MEDVKRIPGRYDLEHVPGNPAVRPGAEVYYVAGGAVRAGTVEYVNLEPVPDVEIRDWETDGTVHAHWKDVYANEKEAREALAARAAEK